MDHVSASSLYLLIPFGLAVVFLLWVLWNLVRSRKP